MVDYNKKTVRKINTCNCVHPNTPILMWNGTTKIAKNITKGDLLIGDNNTPRKVLFTVEGTDNMYKIKQYKGDDYIVNLPHRLTLKYTEHKVWTWEEKYNRYKLTWFNPLKIHEQQKIFTVLMNPKIFLGNKFMYKFFGKKYTKSLKTYNITIHESKITAHNAMINFMNNIPDKDSIIDISVKKYLKLSPNLKKRLKGFKTGVEFNYKPVYIDPYILGMWLSKEYIHSLDTKLEQMHNKQLYYNTRGIIKGKNYFLPSLDFYNLRKNKYIPREFLINRREIRLELLAGLIDVNSFFYDNSCEITHKRKILSENICYLTRSLGFDVKYTKINKTFVYKGEKKIKTLYRCVFSGNGLEEIPCKHNINKVNNKALTTHIQVEYIGKGDFCGFMLNKNGRFLLGDFTVTHNTNNQIDI